MNKYKDTINRGSALALVFMMLAMLFPPMGLAEATAFAFGSAGTPLGRGSYTITLLPKDIKDHNVSMKEGIPLDERGQLTIDQEGRALLEIGVLPTGENPLVGATYTVANEEDANVEAVAELVTVQEDGAEAQRLKLPVVDAAADGVDLTLTWKDTTSLQTHLSVDYESAIAAKPADSTPAVEGEEKKVAETKPGDEETPIAPGSGTLITEEEKSLETMAEGVIKKTANGIVSVVGIEYPFSTEVGVKDGIIQELTITNGAAGLSSEGYMKEAIDRVKKLVVGKPANKESLSAIDTISGATVSAKAIKNTLVEALELKDGGIFENGKTYDMTVGIVKKDSQTGTWVPGSAANQLNTTAKVVVKDDKAYFTLQFVKAFGTSFDINLANKTVDDFKAVVEGDHVTTTFTIPTNALEESGIYKIGKKYMTLFMDWTSVREEGAEEVEKPVYEKGKTYYVPALIQGDGADHVFTERTKLSVDDQGQATLTLCLDMATQSLEMDGSVNTQLETKDGRKYGSYPITFKKNGTYAASLNGLDATVKCDWISLRSYMEPKANPMKANTHYEITGEFRNTIGGIGSDCRVNDYLEKTELSTDAQRNTTVTMTMKPSAGKKIETFEVKNGTEKVDVKRTEDKDRIILTFALPYFDSEYTTKVRMTTPGLAAEASYFSFNWDSLKEAGVEAPESTPLEKGKNYTVAISMRNYNTPTVPSMADGFLDKTGRITVDANGVAMLTYKLLQGQTLSKVMMYQDHALTQPLQTLSKNGGKEFEFQMPTYHKDGYCWGKATIDAVQMEQSYAIKVDWSTLKAEGGETPPVTDPVTPPVVDPVTPPVVDPVTPPVVNPVKPPVTDPVKPAVTTPVKPPVAIPAKPATIMPGKPITAAPAAKAGSAATPAAKAGTAAAPGTSTPKTGLTDKTTAIFLSLTLAGASLVIVGTYAWFSYKKKEQ